MTEKVFDVAVIGAGVVGSAIARELAGTNNSVALVDANSDVCNGTSKANTAILHTGYDAKPGTLEAKLVSRGYHLTMEYCHQTDIGVLTTGAVLVAWDEEQADSLPGLQEKAVQNGYEQTELIPPEKVYELIPSLGPGVTGGLVVPGESIIDAWSVPIAYATDAVNRGAELFLDSRVTSVDVGKDLTTLNTTRGPIRTRWVINSAGLGGDKIDNMFGYDRVHLHPRKGELLVYDKLSTELTDKIVLAAPSKVGKGVLISPTIFGNVMLGPTAEDMEDRTDQSTTEDGFEFLLSKGQRIIPSLLDEEVTAAYAGLRAAHDLTDYLIDVDEAQRYVITTGVRSTGLTSGLAIAEYVRGLLEDTDLDLTNRKDLPAPPTMPRLGAHQLRPYEDDAKIQANPDYGTMVCFCERVSKGEIEDALNSTIPPATLGGLRRRTRAMNGRCQAFFCGAQVAQMFKESKENR